MTCEPETRSRIVDIASGDDVVFRWIVHALFTPYGEDKTHLRFASQPVLDWIGAPNSDLQDSVGRPVGEKVLDYIRQRLGIVIRPYVPDEHPRLIEDDGLPAWLWTAVAKDLRSPTDDPVHVLDGSAAGGKATELRKEERAAIDYSIAPSETSERLAKAMNDRPAQSYTEAVRDNLEAAYEAARKMPGSAAKKRSVFATLRAIERQPKPFYRFSGNGRTDRIFATGRSIPGLPSEVRDTLLEGMYEVDLKSAHLASPPGCGAPTAPPATSPTRTRTSGRG
jgi:hypothetical protein